MKKYFKGNVFFLEETAPLTKQRKQFAVGVVERNNRWVLDYIFCET